MSNLGFPTLGLVTTVAPSASATNLNAANARVMFTFVPPVDKTLSKVKLFATAVTGTLGATDLVLELWSMPTGAIGTTTAPSSLLESRSSVTATPTGAAWVEWTGFTTALTGGTQYALVARNNNGTPASNFPGIRHIVGLSEALFGASTGYAWTKKTSADGGSTYSGGTASAGGPRLEFADGTFLGVPLSNAAATASGSGVYSSRELGVRFTLPSNCAPIRVAGIGACLNAVTGSPTGSPRMRLYTGSSPSLLATTAAAPQWGSNASIQCYFGAIQTIQPGTIITAVLGETTQSDASTNRFNLYEYTVENDANSKALMPLGSWQRAYYDGSSWTLTDTSAIPLWLILDAAQPFAFAGGVRQFSIRGPRPTSRR